MLPAIPIALVLGIFVVRWAIKGKIKPLTGIATLLFGMALGLTPIGAAALNGLDAGTAWAGAKATALYEAVTTR